MKAKFDPDKVSFRHDEIKHRMYIKYKGVSGEGEVPITLMNELLREAQSGRPKMPDYYYTWEFMERCIQHYERNKQNDFN